MFGLILLTLLIAIGPLAYFAGVDSRVDDIDRRRHYSG
jgi:hypothetical protein